MKQNHYTEISLPLISSNFSANNMQAILLLKRNCIFSSFPKLTPISGLSHKEQFPNGTEKVNKNSFLQDLSCLFELYLEPLQKETFLTQDEVREYLNKGPCHSFMG